MEMIDWKIVEANLKCPKCGERGHLEPGTDGTEAAHTHRWPVSREDAMRITRENMSSKQKLTKMLDAMSEGEISQVIHYIQRADHERG